MSPTFTIDQLADAPLAASDSFNKRMTEAWTTHFRNNARIEGGHLHYLATRIKLEDINRPENIGHMLFRKGATLIESTLAHHFETAIPHLAAYLIDEFIENDTCSLRSSDKYGHYPTNEFLESVGLFHDGPLINGQIDYADNVVWVQHALWLKDTDLAEVCQASLIGEPLSAIVNHAHLLGTSKIEAITGSNNSVMVYPELEVRPASTLRIYRTGRDGALLSPNEAAGL